MDRAHLHELIDRLPVADVPTVQRMLELLAEPPYTPLDLAPEEDEEISPQEEAAVAEARAELAAGGKLLSLEEVRRELGL